MTSFLDKLPQQPIEATKPKFHFRVYINSVTQDQYTFKDDNTLIRFPKSWEIIENSDPEIIKKILSINSGLCAGYIDDNFLLDDAGASVLTITTKLLGENTRQTPQDAQGFCSVKFYVDPDGSRVLYMRLLCGKQYYYSRVGSLIMQEIYKLGKYNKCDYIRLDALPHVYNFYHGLGFNIDFVKYKVTTEEDKSSLTEEINKMVQSERENDPVHMVLDMSNDNDKNKLLYHYKKYLAKNISRKTRISNKPKSGGSKRRSRYIRRK
jgi:hypothetical protein